MPATSPRSSLWALFATLIASALYSGVAAYNPGFSVSLGNPGDETLVAHDIHPVTFMSAVLSSSASSAAPCLPFRARAGGAAACVGTDLVVSMVTRNGGVARTFRIGTPDEDIGLGIAWSPLNNLLYIMGRSKGTGQHWVAVVDVGSVSRLFCRWIPLIHVVVVLSSHPAPKRTRL